MWRNGLVIGKFYPPHAGHKFLIDTAQSRVEKLTVVIVDRGDEVPSTALRAAWLREIHPLADIRILTDIGEDDNSELWARYTVKSLGFTPDVVFSSEDYGPRYARCLGCDHVMVDRDRATVPCAGRVIRADPFNNWSFLEGPVRANYCLRIAIVGAESTGTTTLTQDVANAYGTAWAPEYGRLYCEGKMAGKYGSDWNSAEFTHIAQAQNALEDALARTANKVLICDTNSFATALWHERYLDYWSAPVEALFTGRQYGLYVLTDVDIPFVQDGLRDGEHIRMKMHERFKEELNRRSWPYVVATGSRKQRAEQVSLLIDRLLAVGAS